MVWVDEVKKGERFWFFSFCVWKYVVDQCIAYWSRLRKQIVPDGLCISTETPPPRKINLVF